MERVTGIGGVFFRARDPAALRGWYEQHLGVPPTPTSYDQRPWSPATGPTIYEPFPADTDYFDRATQGWMINFRVADLDAIVAQLRAGGIDVTMDPQSYPNGRFARLHDPEGNPVELWEPGPVHAGVGAIDHVELFVPDRQEAAAWYKRVLGFDVVGEYSHWSENPSGPLMISSDDGTTKLALFTGQPQGGRDTAGFHRVAFSVGARGFLAFLDRLPSLELQDHQGRRVAADAVVDHQKAYSIYFVDPYGHRLEVTTYDHEAVRAALTPARSSR
jgi:catechol 2,3-dioxygenase-like lactoylglutathione lyase family enzyme